MQNRRGCSFMPVCEIFYWRIVTALFIMTYMFVKKCSFVSFFERSVMEGKRVTAKQIMAEMSMDIERLAEKIAAAINNAQPGAIIDQSEEPVRDAHAEFRQKTYQKALDLLEQNQQVFSPSADASVAEMEE